MCDVLVITSEPNPFLFGQAELGLSCLLEVWKSQIQCFLLEGTVPQFGEHTLRHLSVLNFPYFR